VRWSGRRSLESRAGGSDPGPGTFVVERPFLDEMRVVEKLLPVPPDEINRRVLAGRLDEADLAAAERLNGMNLRYFAAVVQPLLDEWRREVRVRRARQAWGFAASCAAIVAGSFLEQAAAYVFFFVGTFGFCTAIAAWYGGTAASFGTRLVEKLLPHDGGRDRGET
jgi:hypothetical protein